MCPAPITASLIEPRLALGAGLEPLAQPEVLLGHLQYALLDEGHHAPGVDMVVAARKIAPRRIQPGDVAATAWKQARHARHDSRAGGAGNIRQPGDGSGGHAEKRYEHRAVRAEVEIRQVVIERAGLDDLDAALDPGLARQHDAAEARTALVEARLEHRIFLP